MGWAVTAQVALHGLDVAVVLVYFAGITAFGAFVGRSVGTTRDFFLAGQRFPAWLVAFSCVATLVGSYSFVKYSSRGFEHGLSSSQTYLNDWYWMPLWMLGWLPMIYFGGVLSVPEYFGRRFDRRARAAATVMLLLYLVGYIGINLYTIGVALETLLRGSLGLDTLTLAAITAALCMAYEFTGGQLSVIFTDLVQGVLLLVVGLLLFAVGIAHLGGLDQFWQLLPAGHRQPLPAFNDDPGWNFVGIFCQDGVAGGVAFYFMSQAMLMRFLSARSVGTARRAAALVVIVLMPLAAIAVSGAGWLGAAMVGKGTLPADTAPSDVFVVVAHLLCGPGLFGLVVAAMLAALMSTADTLINASSAVLINDVYRPMRPGRDDRHYLRAARLASLLVAAIGLALVPVYQGFASIYQAHGAFTAAITPPLVAAILLACTWPRMTTAGALATLIGGAAAMLASIPWPGLVAPFAHGVPPDGGYTYVRACYGLAAAMLLGIGVSLCTAPRPRAEIDALTVWGCRKRASTSATAAGRSRRWRGHAAAAPLVADARTQVAADGALPEVGLSRAARARLAVDTGDVVFIDEARWWRGGLSSVRARVGAEIVDGDGTLRLAPAAMRAAGFAERAAVVVERVD